MGIQLVIVLGIGLAVAVIIAVRTYRFFNDKERSSRCPGCSGCEIPKKKAHSGE